MCCVLLQLILLALAVGSGHQASIQTSDQSNGFGYELLLGRMEFLENTMRESQKEATKLGQTLVHELQEFKSLAVDGLNKSQETARREYQESQKNTIKLGETVIRELQEFKGLAVDGLNKSQETSRREFQESQKEAMKLGGMLLSELQEFKGLAIDGLKKSQETLLQELQEFKGLYSDRDSGITSCRKTPNNNESGRYKLKLMNTAFEVFCEQNLYGGGWIVIQNRFDGSVSFRQGWSNYRNGFGSLDGEFWVGLEKIHLITSSENHELMIHLEDFNGVTKYAHYKKFSIRDEQEKYCMPLPAPYNGTAGDSFFAHRHDKFSTFNQDNDADNEKNLASWYDSGWWFSTISDLKSNLNGLYRKGSDYSGMHWYTFNHDRQALKVSKMMIRERV